MNVNTIQCIHFRLSLSVSVSDSHTHTDTVTVSADFSGSVPLPVQWWLTESVRHSATVTVVRHGYPA